MFGKRRDGDDGGLGRGVVPDVLTLEKSEGRGSARPASETVIDAAAVVDEVTAAKPSRAERRAAAKTARADARRDGVVDGSTAIAPRKLTRAQRRAEAAAAQSASDDLRPSKQVMIEFYPGMAKEDAIETARHWAMTHMEMPSLCFYYVQKIHDGYAVEVQEGVGKAYLPSVIELAQASPGRLVIVPMIRRKMTVYYSGRTAEFDAQVLPELQEPPSMPENPAIQATRGPAMTPVMKQHREWLVAGAATAAIGGLALLSSIAFYAFDPKSKVPPEWRTTDVAQLPIMQWNRLQADSSDSYVVRLEFQDGQWRIVRQAVGASVDVARPDASDSAGQIVGGLPGGPSGPPDIGGSGPSQGQPAGIGAPSPVGGVNIPPPGPAAAGN